MCSSDLFARFGKGVCQKLGDGKAEDAVAEEFETLIVFVGPSDGARARMGQGQLQQFRVGKVVPDPGREIFECRFARRGQGSVHRLKNARPADAGRPMPELQEPRVLVHREEDDLRLAHQILKGDEADFRQKAAVG